MGEFNTEKHTTTKVPFFSVKRDAQGKVEVCIKNEENKCGGCIFKTECKISAG